MSPADAEQVRLFKQATRECQAVRREAIVNREPLPVFIARRTPSVSAHLLEQHIALRRKFKELLKQAQTLARRQGYWRKKSTTRRTRWALKRAA